MIGSVGSHMGGAGVMCLCYFGLPVAYMLPVQVLFFILPLDRSIEE